MTQIKPDIMERRMKEKYERAQKAINDFQTNRHIWGFKELLSMLNDEITFFRQLKENGHKLTKDEKKACEIYEQIFNILANSPFNQ